MLSFETCIVGNSIQKLTGLESGYFANLATLELRGNQLDSTKGINLPNLRHLYLVLCVSVLSCVKNNGLF